MTRKHTVTITKPNGEILTLAGEDVNTCAASGIDRHHAWLKVDAFFGFEGLPTSSRSTERRSVVQVEESLFRRGYTMSIAPMVQDQRNVWHTDEARRKIADVTILTDWRK